MSGNVLERIATVAALAAGCLSAGVAFAAAPPLSTGAAEGATGERPGNSQAGSAVVEATNVAPGERRSATVTITNHDAVPASFSLTTYGLRERPGRGGGDLSARLELLVEDVAQPAPVTVYRGALGSMPAQALGTFRPGESRGYRFTVSFSDRRARARADAVDNAYMGGSLSLGFRWRSSR